MSIATEIQKLQTNLANAYDALEDKGATMPASQTMANLVGTIESIPTGSSVTPSQSQVTLSSTYSEVCAKVDWCKAKFLEEGGKGSYTGAWLALRDDSMTYEDFTLRDTQVKAIKTSDGHTYTTTDG